MSGRLTRLCSALAVLVSSVGRAEASTTDVDAPVTVVGPMMTIFLGSNSNNDLPSVNVTLANLFISDDSEETLANETCLSGACYHDDNDLGAWQVMGLDLSRLGQFVEWYSESLETHPVLTKSTTAAFIGACGDIFAQIVDAWADGLVFQWTGLDLRRTFAISAEGMLISGPLMHISYEILEEHFPVFAEENSSDEASSYSSWLMVICQVLVDALIMDSVFVATVIVASAILEGRGARVLDELKAAYIPSVKASWISSLCWSPVQLLSFKYVPLQFRVAAVNLQDIAWSATISFMAHRCQAVCAQDKDKSPERDNQ